MKRFRQLFCSSQSSVPTPLSDNEFESSIDSDKDGHSSRTKRRGESVARFFPPLFRRTQDDLTRSAEHKELTAGRELTARGTSTTALHRSRQEPPTTTTDAESWIKQAAIAWMSRYWWKRSQLLIWARLTVQRRNTNCWCLLGWKDGDNSARHEPGVIITCYNNDGGDDYARLSNLAIAFGWVFYTFVWWFERCWNHYQLELWVHGERMTLYFFGAKK